MAAWGAAVPNAGGGYIFWDGTHFSYGATAADAVANALSATAVAESTGGGSDVDVVYMTNPMTTLHDTIVGGAAGAPARLAVGAEGKVLTVVTGAPAWADLPADTDAGGGGGGGTLLANVEYNPTSLATYTDNSSGTLKDVDATNLIATFTAPASGNVKIELDGFVVGAGGNGSVWWAVLLVGGADSVAQITSAGTGLYHASFVITGLTPGTSYSYKWRFCCDHGGTVTMYAGGVNRDPGGVGPACMRVYSC